MAIQYSYLPSWISYLVDQSKAREAGRALFDAVYGAWVEAARRATAPSCTWPGRAWARSAARPPSAAKTSMANRTNGALFVGPPNFNTLVPGVQRPPRPGQPGGPARLPGRPDRAVRERPGQGIPPAGQPWDGSRILYLMHPSDPIVWWSPHLIFSEPDWISEPPGKDVLKAMFWMPFVTFWQVTADLPFATGVPGGHGHKYTAEYVDGWNAVMRPGLTTQDLTDLQEDHRGRRVIAGHARVTAQATRRPPPPRTPSPFVAQCRPAGASRLPLRRRSSQNTTPARPVNTTVPSTEMAWPDVPFRPRSRSPGCPRPGRVTEARATNRTVRTRPRWRSTSRVPPQQAPQHPAEGDLLEQHRPQRDEHESGQQGVSPAQVVAAVAERVAGQRKRRARREHHGHGGDRPTPRPARAATFPAQAELLPAEPGPPGERQEPRGARRPEHQRRMRYADIDHVDGHENGDDDRQPPSGGALGGGKTSSPSCRSLRVQGLAVGG